MNDQRSLEEQMQSLVQLAVAHGLYDAADWLLRWFPRQPVAEETR